MKIGSLDSKPTSAPAASERKTPAKTGGTEPSSHVELSSAATLAGAKGTEGTQAADGTFDTEKVKRIAQAIKDGQYVVHPEVIADKLISNAQELLGKTNG